MQKLFCVALCMGALLSGSANSKGGLTPRAPVRCDIGPITKTYGDGPWLVYACDDSHSVMLISANPAQSFQFNFHWQGGEYRFSGSGTAQKPEIAAALEEIRVLSQSDIETLYSEAKEHS
jgi:hypothetical protein